MSCTKDQLKDRYYPVKCDCCGWSGCSCDCDGGGPTGGDDFDDISCPVCGSLEPDEYNPEEKEIKDE